MRGLPWYAWMAGAVGLATAMAASGAAAQSPTPMLLAAHRGGSLLWPENSLLAFRNALALGADFVE
ncbi:MAG TPA: glycerophosphodiester phosphodiesterase family protein, partial [Candidatus Bathyarchaeia archaeon]|nr:glycerophosphodiester phosphodiesterase family protein [Candidatus Bathyarchaeia archaeon]